MWNRARVFFLLAAVILGQAACLAGGPGLIILCAGDSLTAQGYPPYLRRILVRDGIRSRVANYGRSGATSGEFLAFLEEEEDRLKEERPDVVLVALGTNDLRTDHDFTPTEIFRRNLQAIIERFRTFRSRSGRIPLIVLATIPDIPLGDLRNFDGNSARRVEDEINPAIRDIAAAAGLPVVDNHAVFAGRPDLLPRVHPAPEGYRAMAENWRKALRSRL